MKAYKNVGKLDKISEFLKYTLLAGIACAQR